MARTKETKRTGFTQWSKAQRRARAIPERVRRCYREEMLSGRVCWEGEGWRVRIVNPETLYVQWFRPRAERPTVWFDLSLAHVPTLLGLIQQAAVALRNASK